MYEKILSWYVNWRGKTLHTNYKQRYFSGITNTRILEIGAGGGMNFQWYPHGAHVTVIEPNKRAHSTMQAQANERQITLDIYSDPKTLDTLPDNSFEVVLDTLVLCSVKDAQHTLQQIDRVLKPEGTYYFLEHVLAPVGTIRNWAQRVFGPLWKVLTGDCECTRPLGEYIIAQFPYAQYTYFSSTQLHHPLSNYLIIGSAHKELPE